VNCVTVSYSGVHQAYQIALAAHEMSRLDQFYCSLFDAPGHWGRFFSRLVGEKALVNRRRPEIPSDKVRENPWPLLRHQLVTLFNPTQRNDWYHEAAAFDEWVSRDLAQTNAEIFIGVETCAEYSFEAAKRLGRTLILDHPPIPAEIWRANACRASQDLGLPAPKERDSAAMSSRKAAERNLADWILVYSEFHKSTLIEIGVPATKLVKIPLWADDVFSSTSPCQYRDSRKQLRVLYVGGINLRKGVPYLLKAVAQSSSNLHLTLVGDLSDELRTLIREFPRPITIMKPQTKAALSDLYRSHDVFVLPSLGDSWGFVGMEAMLCGLPIIATQNCGLPLPSESWRVPVMDSDAIRTRLDLYARDTDLVRHDGAEAAKFAKRFTPATYRNSFRAFLETIL
jgi:glycosyltransferase involved in cell wall biosynthesis